MDCGEKLDSDLVVGAKPAVAAEDVDYKSWNLVMHRKLGHKIFIPRKKVNVTTIQGKDSTNLGTGDSRNVQVKEKCDDSTIILHKELPHSNYKSTGASNMSNVARNNETNTSHIPNKQDYQTSNNITLYSAKNSPNNAHNNIQQNIEQMDKSIGQDVDSSIKETIVTRHIVLHDVNDSTTDKIGDSNTEVVWLPVSSPRRELQEFLNFSTEGNAVVPSRGTEENLEEKMDDKIFHVTRMELCKEWLKHPQGSGFEQHRRLLKYVSTKVDLNSVTELHEDTKHIISSISYQLSQMWNRSGRNPQTMFTMYSPWFQRPPIKFTPISPLTKNKESLVNESKDNPKEVEIDSSKTLLKDIKTNQSKPLLRIELDTNADLFKFLKRSVPPFKPELLYTILISLSNLTEENKSQLRKFCQRYVTDMKFKYMTADFKDDIFQSKFAFWLTLSVRWPAFIKDIFLKKSLISKKTADKTDKSQAEVPFQKLPISALEESLAKKCSEISQRDVSDVIHRLIRHPEDAARIQDLINKSKCSCKHQTLFKQSERSNNSLENEENIEGDKSTERDGRQKREKGTERDGSQKIEENPEIDPLKIELEIDLTDEQEEVTDNPYPTWSPDKVEPQRFYKVTNEHRNALKQVLQKLKEPTEPITRPAQPSEESNDTEYTSESNDSSSVNELVTSEKSKMIESPSTKGLEFGPVVDKLLFTQRSNLESGTKVIFRNMTANILDVSNVNGASVLVPISDIKRGCKVIAPNIKNRVSNKASPYNIVQRVNHLAPSSNNESRTTLPSASVGNRITALGTRTKLINSGVKVSVTPNILKRVKVLTSPNNIDKMGKITTSDIRKTTKMPGTQANNENRIKLIPTPNYSENRVLNQTTPSILQKRATVLGTPTNVEKRIKVLAGPSIKKSYTGIESPTITKQRYNIPHDLKKTAAVQALLSDIKSGALKRQKTPINIKISRLMQLPTNASESKMGLLADFKLSKNTFILPTIKRPTLEKSPSKRPLELVSVTSEGKPTKRKNTTQDSEI